MQDSEENFENVIKLAEAYGWDGVNNSKILSVFLADLLKQLSGIAFTLATTNEATSNQWHGAYHDLARVFQGWSSGVVPTKWPKEYDISYEESRKPPVIELRFDWE